MRNNFLSTINRLKMFASCILTNWDLITNNTQQRLFSDLEILSLDRVKVLIFELSEQIKIKFQMRRRSPLTLGLSIFNRYPRDLKEASRECRRERKIIRY